MSVSLLNLSLVEGFLTRDPELFYTKQGVAVCKFDVAVNFNFKKDGQDVSEVSFITVNTWNKVAESSAKYLKKGSKVRVKGRLKQQTWDPGDGTKKSKIHIEANSVEFLNTSKNTEEAKQKKNSKIPF